MYNMNAFIWFMVMIAGFAYCTYKFVAGIEPTTPQKTNNVNEGRELLNTRLVKECGVWCAPSDTYYTADKEAFANFAREKAFLEHARNSHKYWRFIKCNGKRYAVRIDRPTTDREWVALFTKLNKGTLEGFTPYPDYNVYCLDFDPLGRGSKNFKRIVLQDFTNWAGAYEYTRGSHRRTAGYNHYINYSWTPSVIKNGYAVIKMYDAVLDREYEKKFTLPVEYANICNLKYGVDIIEL